MHRANEISQSVISSLISPNKKALQAWFVYSVATKEKGRWSNCNLSASTSERNERELEINYASCLLLCIYTLEIETGELPHSSRSLAGSPPISRTRMHGPFFLRLSLVTPAHCKKESFHYNYREILVHIHIPRSPPGHLRTNVLRKFCKIAS